MVAVITLGVLNRQFCCQLKHILRDACRTHFFVAAVSVSADAKLCLGICVYICLHAHAKVIYVCILWLFGYVSDNLLIDMFPTSVICKELPFITALTRANCQIRDKGSGKLGHMRLKVCMRVCVRACVRACVHACACVGMKVGGQELLGEVISQTPPANTQFHLFPQFPQLVLALNHNENCLLYSKDLWSPLNLLTLPRHFYHQVHLSCSVLNPFEVTQKKSWKNMVMWP